MTRFVILAAVAASLAAVLLLQLQDTSELVAWVILLLVILAVMLSWRPKAGRDDTPPLFGEGLEPRPHPPRSVSSFELAAVHAFSESPGADRRLKNLMRRTAAHRLRQRGVTPGTPRADELVDPVLFSDTVRPLTERQLLRIVDQLEAL